MYYVVIHHGSAGVGCSYGYAELYDYEPQESMTQTVYGPYEKPMANILVDFYNDVCETYRWGAYC